MRQFVALVESLEMATNSQTKIDALVDYFSRVSSADASWALYFLTGRKLKRVASSRSLANWAKASLGEAAWLYDDAHLMVGEVAETIALLLDQENTNTDLSLSHWLEERLIPLQSAGLIEQQDTVTTWWQELDYKAIYLLNKILQGELRVDCHKSLLTQSLANLIAVPEAVMAQRFPETWEPLAERYEQLIAGEAESGMTYPFVDVPTLTTPVESLGSPKDWLMERTWGGLKAQWIHRDGRIALWSNEEGWLTERFPELCGPEAPFPEGTVLSGEIVVFQKGSPQPFSELQRRLKRKAVTKSTLAELPVVMMVHDLLEVEGTDITHLPLAERRKHLESLMQGCNDTFSFSAGIALQSWEQALELRELSVKRSVQGVLLRRLDAPYIDAPGQVWFWKREPHTVSAVLLYAQPGRDGLSLYSDYTVAVRHENRLVPIAKELSGLTDEEATLLDAWIRSHTVERFGPVRSVEPCHVFEIAFEGIAESKRHKAGLTLQAPRILQWCPDKSVDQVHTLESLRQLLQNKTD